MDSYDTELAAVKDEIRSAFTQHFAGKPAIALPHLAFSGGYEQVALQSAREAIHDALDYDDTDDALHGMITGSVTLEQFREAIVARYIVLHADDIVWKRTGLSVPRKTDWTPELSFLTVLTKEAA